MKNKVDILFSEPGVFSILENWTYFKEHKCGIDFVKNHHLLGTCDCYKNHLNDREQSKANAIRIENPEIINKQIGHGYTPEGIYYYFNNRTLKHGDIFRVEGFEYEVKEKCKICDAFTNEDCKNLPDDCDVMNEKVAVLKLEEPKEKEQLFGVIHEFEQIGYNQAIDDVLEKQALLIQNCFLAIENGGAEYYPFDGHTLESLGGMKRAYSHAMEEIKKLKK